MEDLDAMFAEASARTTAIQGTAQLDALTPEEEQELREFALQRMRGNNISTETQQEQETTKEPEPEPIETPVEEIPKEEQPVIVPDYSAVRAETSRFSSAEWFKKVQEQVVILAGVGGIGSNMAIILAKLNPKAIYLFDGDTVEAANLSGQFYSADDIGKFKVDAIAESIVKYTNYSTVFACPRFYQPGEEIVSGVMVCGFDTMRARRSYYNAWKHYVASQPEDKKKECLFIDGRLTADKFQILCMTGEDAYYLQEYENKWLFEDYEAERTVCSFKQTGYLADMIGAFMVNLLVNFCANLSNPQRQMPLPFLTEYNSNIVYLNTSV